MTELAYSETGNGPALVILHGLFGSARNWGRIARDLSADFRIITADLPNHGESPWVDALDYPTMADAVAQFLRARGLYGIATVLGHSMGGKAAMTLALRAPDALARLVVVDIAPVAYGHAQGNVEIVDALLGLPLSTIASRRDADAALAPSIDDPVMRAYLLANLVRDGERFAWRLNLEGLKRSMPALHGFPDPPGDARYDGPTLFIAGGESRYIRPEHRPEIERRFPQARIETVAGAGHWVHADAPAEVAALIASFMSGA